MGGKIGSRTSEGEEGSVSDVEDVFDDVPPGQGQVGQLDVEGGARRPLRLFPPVEHLDDKFIKENN